ncbi:glucose dehydrogenase [Caballeronia novacaledonica]|uniref:Glucose dehydrogenase n=1 Tax=Caballeronia novacaledonica TaxID=1544861 RepID=A0A2U3IDA0_9BURK|nr:GMC family oxidoreductase [Caballeronia novacaledonica]SPB18195.1 glucose dehydrogenase [Caballeronia novacaledonica]
MGNKHYDALVIGSGAAGSFAAKELTERGLEVIVLEAGRNVTPADFESDFKGPREKGIQLWARAKAAVTGQPIQSKVALYGKQLRHLFVNDRDNPYTTPDDSPFLWIRGKQLGGRLHTYGRVLMRWSDYDFKAASRDGFGEDWPISYADLEPHYGKVEEFLGIYGCADNVRNVPNGKFKGPSKLTATEKEFKACTETRWPERSAIAWRYMPPNIKRIPQPILAAKETGRLTVRTDAIVKCITTDPSSGKATGAEFIDRVTKQVESVKANVVVVCASTIESSRLLLNSKSAKHPSGLGNSSGVLGRYFMDQVPSLIVGSVPGVKGWELDDTVPADPFYGVTGGVYIPRYENLDKVTNSGFARGFAYQGTIGRLFSRDDKPAKFGVMGFGEMLPHYQNSVTLDDMKTDAWGLPVPKISCSMTQNEVSMLKEQTRAIKEMMDNAGLDVEFNGSSLGLEEFGKGAFPEADAFSRLLFRQNFTKSMAMGAAIHETGGVRMGADPSKSILNSHNQSWDVPNLFVTDASSFPSGGCAGATLTAMAVTVRACEYIADQYNAGRL